MKNLNKSLKTVRHAGLSLWQSIVAAQARREIETLGANSPYQHYLDHHLVQATNLYAEKAFAGERIIHSDCEPGVYFKQPFDLVALSAEAHQLVQSIQDSEFLTHENILENIPVRCYSTKDRDFIGICGVIYAEYKLKYGSPAVFYRDWNKPGKGLGYGIIQHKLPQNAKVALIGDWATGLDDTKELIKALLRLKLDAIIHLGDIYYAGTPDIKHDGQVLQGECTENFIKVFQNAYSEIAIEFRNKRESFVPPAVFNLAGNHDYYCMGKGYFEMVHTLPEALGFDTGFRQEASYFQLMLEGDDWQFLAMDTGRNDYSVVNVINPDETGPKLEPYEVIWHHHKLHTFPGKTILLSHHQLFSAHDKINGNTSSSKTYFGNDYLFSYFKPFFPEKVHAWFWGHEHNLAGYEDGQMGLSKGRLVGNGGYQANETFDHPDKVTYPQIRANTEFQVKRDSEGYLYHSACLIDFEARDHTGNPLVYYWQMPSWGRNERPANIDFSKMPRISEYLTPFQFNMLPYLPTNFTTDSSFRMDAYMRKNWKNVGKASSVIVGREQFKIQSPFDPVYGNNQFNLEISVQGSQATISINCNYNSKVWGDWQINTDPIQCYYEFDFLPIPELFGNRLPFGPEAAAVIYTQLGFSGSQGLRVTQYQSPANRLWYPSVTFKIEYNRETYWIAVENMNG